MLTEQPKYNQKTDTVDTILTDLPFATCILKAFRFLRPYSVLKKKTNQQQHVTHCKLTAKLLHNFLLRTSLNSQSFFLKPRIGHHWDEKNTGLSWSLKGCLVKIT